MKRNRAGLILSGLMVVLLIACEEIDAGAGAPPETITDEGVAYVVIAEESDFKRMRAHPTENYYLWRDIALTGDFEPIGDDSAPFRGIFEGNNKTISNLRIVKSDKNSVGLFRQIGVNGDFDPAKPEANGVVRNLTLALIDDEDKPSVEGANHVGALAGKSYGKIEAVGVEGGFVKGANEVGGLVGRNSGSITSSYVTGSVTLEGTGDQSQYIGGLVGWNNGSITSSYATGEVALKGTGRNIGGLVGINNGPITSSYATGSVEGASQVGGLVGFNYNTITSSYFDSSTEGTNQTNGIGQDDNNQSVKGYETDMDILQQTDFTDWNFNGADAVWRWVENGRWPLLAWQENDPRSEFPPETITDEGVAYVVIAEESDFKRMRAHPTENYYLWRDIALTGDFEPIGNDSAPFTGIFEGNNKTISNLRIVKSDENSVGLFRQIGVNGDFDPTKPDANGVVRNLTLVLVAGNENNPSVEGANHVGALAGRSYGKIEAVGVVGGFVKGANEVGGLVGRNSGSITSSYVTGSVTLEGTGDQSQYIGGLVGWNNGSITSSYATGEVTLKGTGDQSQYIGGLVGINNGPITSSYATGLVTGTGNHVGGLVGIAAGGSITSSYFDSSTEGTNQTQGVGNVSNAVGVTDYDTSTHTLKRTDFAGWNFDAADWIFDGVVEVWRWVENGRWPLLAWQENDPRSEGPPETITLDGVTYTVIVGESDFEKMRDDLTGNYYLWRDVALSTDNFEPIGNDSAPFTGIFEGNNKTISNLRIVKSDENSVGLFRQIGVNGIFNPTKPDANGVVRNLTLVLVAGNVDDPSVEGVNHVGALAGRSYGKIEAVGVEGGFVKGRGINVGGLVGYAYGDIKKSYATGSVKGDSFVGGLVGYAYGDIKKSYATGSVTGSFDYVGGLVGSSDGDINKSYATGLVTGTGNHVGGLVGIAAGGSITSSYFDSSTEGTNQTQGVGNVPNAVGVTDYDSLSGSVRYNGTDVMQSDFVDWIFDGDDAVWRWVADGQWPLLAWQ